MLWMLVKRGLRVTVAEPKHAKDQRESNVSPRWMLIGTLHPVGELIWSSHGCTSDSSGQLNDTNEAKLQLCWMWNRRI